MKPSAIAIHIALFSNSYPTATTEAFVHHRHHGNTLTKRRSHNHRSHNVQKQQKHQSPARLAYRSHDDKVSSLLDSSMGSSASEIIEMLPMTPPTSSDTTNTEVHSEPATIRKRHALFKQTNAISKQTGAPHPELWRRCLPNQSKHEQNKQNEKGGFWDFYPLSRGFLPNDNEKATAAVPLLRDVHVQFDNPALGARQLLEQCGIVTPSTSAVERSDDSSASLPLPETIMAETETIQHLTHVLTYFQSIASSASLSNDETNVKCIARVVSTIGQIGTKCPRWHADHVPVRLVMSILGPGCEYIPEGSSSGGHSIKVVNRQALNNLDEEDTMKANDIIVPPELLSEAERRLGKEGVIKHASEGEVVLLMGRGWEEGSATADGSDCSNDVDEAASHNQKVLAAVHRSPILSPSQERILLTVDLVDW